MPCKLLGDLKFFTGLVEFSVNFGKTLNAFKGDFFRGFGTGGDGGMISGE